MDLSVTVNINAKMYEGATESTNEEEDEENTEDISLPQDSIVTGGIRLYNEGGGDHSDIGFTITNNIAP